MRVNKSELFFKSIKVTVYYIHFTLQNDVVPLLLFAETIKTVLRC